mgnify:CR=1 FL=1
MAQNTRSIESVWATKGNLPDSAIIATSDGKYPALDGSLITGVVSTELAGEPAGSDLVLNAVSLTQAEYNAGTPVETTFYIITP